MSIYLSVYLQAWKRSYSARLPQFLNLTTSKMEQFCETSWIFELDNVKHKTIQRDFLNFLVDSIKNEAILRDFLQKWKVECRADGLVPLRFAIFPLHLSEVPRLPRKKRCQVIRRAAPVTQNHLSKPEDLMLQNAAPLRNMSLVLRLPRKMHLCRSSSNVPRLPSFLEMPQNPHVLLNFDTLCTIPCACHAKRHLNVKKWSEDVRFLTLFLRNVLRATTACTFSTSQLLKVLRGWSVLYILIWKFASRHNGVHFFDIATSKSVPNLVCFVHFDLEMRFAPQRRALFRHLNFQKCSEPGVLWILTWKCASRHNGVQFFISHLASWLRTRRFSEPTFRPSGATNHWKNTVFRDFPTFSRTCIFFLLRLSLFWSSFFFSSLLWLFPSLLFVCPYCRKFDF